MEFAHHPAPSDRRPEALPGSHRSDATPSSSASSVQNPRVTEIRRDSGPHSSPSSPHRFGPPTPPSQPRNLYASSAPSSSSALRQQQQQQHSTRPPVPLFPSHSTGNVHLHQSNLPLASPVTSSEMAHDLGLFDLTSPDLSGPFGADAPPYESAFASPRQTTVHELQAPFAMAHHHVTVSPKDLVRDAEASAPPSAAFTNLTSPSNFGSPDVYDSFETSPIFSGLEGDLAQDSWYPLFPGVNAEPEESPVHAVDDFLDPVEHAPRRYSTPLESPSVARSSSGGGKHASVSGVSARKRDRPLATIRVEDQPDSVAMKRARNTLAARKSRQKKVERLEELERTVEDLRGEVLHWKNLALRRNPGSGL